MDKLSRTATFEELGFDSLDGVEMVVAMEELFGFDITNEEAEKITSVQEAITIFNKNLVEKINKDKLTELHSSETSPATKNWHIYVHQIRQSQYGSYFSFIQILVLFSCWISLFHQHSNTLENN